MPLTLVQAVLKGDKMDDVVRDATMAGVAHDRAGRHRAIADRACRRSARDSRGALAAGRGRVGQAVPAGAAAADPSRRPFDEWLAAPFDGAAAAARRAVGRRTDSAAARCALLQAPAPESASPASSVPKAAGRRGARGAPSGRLRARVTLGPLTLRADAVALAALAIVAL